MINLKINTEEEIYNIKCKRGTSFKDAIKYENINFRFPCGGTGRCGNCKIKILKGVEKPSRIDEIKLKKNELDNNIRLACCTFIKNDTEIFLNEIKMFNFLD